MFQSFIDKIYALTDKGLLRALSLLLALSIAAAIFWDPKRFAAQTSPLEIWQSMLLIWAVCTALIHGSGFRPQKGRWRLIFLPLPAILTLLMGCYYLYVS